MRYNQLPTTFCNLNITRFTYPLTISLSCTSLRIALCTPASCRISESVTKHCTIVNNSVLLKTRGERSSILISILILKLETGFEWYLSKNTELSGKQR